VLDHGLLRVVNVMGDESSIVQAARVSYGSGTRTKREDDKLVAYLYRNKHMSPFEMAEITLHVKLPIFVARQWIRHRTASVNEESLRYSEACRDFYIPAPDLVRYQDKKNKQGSAEKLPIWEAKEFATDLTLLCEQQLKVYDKWLERGVSRETARLALGLNLYTSWYWKTDLRNLLHFLELRNDSHAQAEIREYARVIENDILQHWCPTVWGLLQEGRLATASV